MKCKLFFAILAISCQISFAQNSRLFTTNTIGWYNYLGTFKLSEKTGMHTEYQWRRNDLLTSWQQGLLRVGLNYNLTPRVLLRGGYAWAETYPYGEYPLNKMGRDFTEHRIFEMVQLSQKEGVVEISHRFMLEQRFIGRYSSVNVMSEDEFPLAHRARYMIRLQVPLNGREIKDKTAYLAAYDEILIGFGKNVNTNIFDQNRIGILLGYRFTKNVRIEGGYINQTLQLGRQINGQNIFQNNNGLILNATLNLDLTKSKE
jgi:hypothetical protein